MRRVAVCSSSSVLLLISVCVARGELRNSTDCGGGAARLVKIQGGSPLGPWPWLCGLQVNTRLRCGATVIQTSPSRTLLLSAAHCLGDLGPADLLQVVCGDPLLQNSSLVDGVALTVRKV